MANLGHHQPSSALLVIIMIFTLNPVGHQSTNWMFFCTFIPAMDAFTSWRKLFHSTICSLDVLKSMYGAHFVKHRWISCPFQHECHLINRSPLGQHLLCRASIRTCTFLQKNEICLKLKMKFTFFRITFDHLVLCFEAGPGKESCKHENFREGDGTVTPYIAYLRIAYW